MIINHNIPALNAYRNLSMNQSAQSKSMEKLSSGLRINRAADDAAGLAISETMKAQINGLDQASRNSQDAISLLQTAEGALTETHSILQRMRTLSVQAANDTYTSNDRQEIQKEVDQLKDEIDRIANTTTFNNKNLLDGTAAALTSTDNVDTKVFLRGALKSAGGNYKLTIDANAGNAQIQKSDIFKQKSSGDSVQKLSIDENSGIQHLSATDIARGSYQVITTNNIASTTAWEMTANVGQTFRKNGGSMFGTTATVLSASVNGAASSVNASILMEVVGVTSSITAVGRATNITVKLSWYEYNRSGKYLNSAGNFAFTGNIKLQTKTITVSGGAWNALATNVGHVRLTMNLNSGGVAVGDKSTINVKASSLGNTLMNEVRVNHDATNNIASGTDAANPYRDKNVVDWVFRNDYLDNKATSFSNFTLSASGKAYSGNIKLTFDGLDTSTASGGTFHTTFKFADGLNQVASLDTKLKDIDKFYDASGKFLLDDSQQLSLIQGDGTKTTIQLYGTDTIQDVVSKLNDAIGNKLGQNKLIEQADQGKFVSFVTKPADSGPEALEGTFVIRSAKAGADGKINIVGSEQLINALSLTDVQSATESQFTVNVTNAHDPNDKIATDVAIQGNLLIGVVDPNVDVKFNSNADIDATFNSATKTFDLKGDATSSYTTFVHIVNNSQVFQIGSNEDQNMNAAIGNMGADALDVRNVTVTDRESAGRAITKIDNAISRVSSQRSSLGAVQNRLEHTINNLGVASENLTAAQARITDVDMASEMMTFSKLNIMSQAATAMLAQANQQPQMVLQLLGR